MSTYEQVDRKKRFFLKDFFTISEVSKVCNVSRSTIMRLEERGLLTPAHIDEQSGYRYYDNHNINKILQIKAFQEMGLQYDDILEYYTSGGGSRNFLRKLEHKLSAIKHTVEELRLWYDNTKHLSFEFIDLPDCVCYARSFTGTGFSDQYKDMYNLCHEAFKKGYRMIPTELMFIIHPYDEYFSEIPDGEKEHYTCCIPVEPDCASEETTFIPGGKALSILYYGDFSHIREEVPQLLLDKMKELDLKHKGIIRGMCPVAPYMGKEIKNDNFVSRLVIPLDE